MLHFGIRTNVLAQHSRIGWYLNEYKTQPDKKFGGGLGKMELLKILKYQLPLVDGYFDSNPHLATSANPRWQDFCEDCLVLATLSAFLNDEQIILIHPDAYKPTEGLNSRYEKIDQKPSLIKGFDIRHPN